MVHCEPSLEKNIELMERNCSSNIDFNSSFEEELDIAEVENDATIMMLREDTTTNTSAVDCGSDGILLLAEDATLKLSRQLMYTSHFFAQFSEVAWQFSIALFLAAVTNYQSLVLVSTYGFFTAVAVCFCSPIMGRVVDRCNRLKIAQRLIWCENVSIITATVLCYILLKTVQATPTATATTTTTMTQQENTVDHETSWIDTRLEHVPTDSWIHLLFIHILGATAQVLDQAFTVAIERDWVVVMSKASANATVVESHMDMSSNSDEHVQLQFHKHLTTMNVTMRQIDLACKVAAPAIAGFLIIPAAAATAVNKDATSGDYTDAGTSPPPSALAFACLLVGAVNVLALIVEFICTYYVYKLIPALAEKTSTDVKKDEQQQQQQVDEDDLESNDYDQIKPGAQHPNRRLGALRIYFAQPIAVGGLGLALLYTNPVTFGNGLTTAYLLSRGLALGSVGSIRGIAAAIGLLGTFVYNLSAKYLSLETTAMWSVSHQCICLTLGFLSMFLPNDSLAVILLIAFGCAGRIGLWVFDIAITQMQQEEISDGIRGVVGGTQQSLNSFFNLMSYFLVVKYPDPADFQYYVALGAVSVALAVILFAFGIYIPRKMRMAI